MTDIPETGRRFEIEVTGEMIDAAELYLCGFNTDYEGYREGSRNIVEAALVAGGYIK